MLWWDKNNPLHREIMDANKEAWIARQSIEYQNELDRIERALPWWARLYLRIAKRVAR